MQFYKVAFTLLTAFCIQQASANHDYPGIVDGHGYTADQSGLLAGLYTVKSGYFKTTHDAIRTNEQMATMFVDLNHEMRPYCDGYVSHRDWTNSYWQRSDKYAAAYVLYERQAAYDMDSLDVSIRQLQAQERAECAHLTKELIDIRNDMRMAWSSCSEDYRMLKNDWHRTAYDGQWVDGRYYVHQSWLDNVQSCHDRSYTRRSAYHASYSNLEARLDNLIDDIRVCYRLN